MRKFKFTLNTLLTVKISLEKQKSLELADQNRVILMLEIELDALKARLKASTNEYGEKMEKGGMSAGDIAAYSTGIRALFDRIAEQMESIRRAVKVKEKITDELITIMGERKMLENLKEKQYAEYLDEVRREDAKIIDDFMSTKIAGETENG
ncbi:MAG: flagellar export protein FliJ [Oscillospiraceae bacterium]|nr:flagellar export protein FliJ [Oscillospiraceae bacterium]